MAAGGVACLDVDDAELVVEGFVQMVGARCPG
jgi:hypothetical protein